MSQLPVSAVDVQDGPNDQAAEDEGLLVEEDLLVEDVSIDGMCGVY
jgi:mycofactocin precursor